MREITAPIYDFEKKLIEERQPEYEMEKQNLDILKARLEDLKKIYVKSANGSPRTSKDGKAAGRSPAEIKKDIEELAAEIAEKKEPTMPTLITSDTTEEKLIKLAADSGGVISNFSAEGELFANASGRYNSNNSSFDALLKGYTGDPIRQDRIGRAPQYIDKPRFTVAASVQPIVLKQLAAKPEFKHKGFTGRFLYAVPYSYLGYRQVNAAPIPKAVKDRYWNGILKLLDENWKTVVPQTLKLSHDADQLLVEFEKHLEPKLRMEGELRPIVDWAAKLSGSLVRIAGLLHLADHAADTEKPLVVEVDTMSRALLFSEFLINHCKVAYAVMDTADDNELLKAKRILNWLQDSKLKEFSQRKCHRAHQALFLNSSDVKATLDLLEEHEYIRKCPSEHTVTGGRKGVNYKINPLMTNVTIVTKCEQKTNSVTNVTNVIKTTNLKTEIEPVFLSEMGKEFSDSGLEGRGM